MMIFDTIAAVATPRGKGGVAIIRISGERAIEIAQKVFRAFNGKPLSEQPLAKLTYGEIYRKRDGGEDICIDDGMAAVFRAPHSFTGEDTVEINCHGGALVTRSVLESVIEAGARMATAGEYTRRAFVNGKMKLTQAEALGYLLDAENENQLLLSRGGMRGILSGKTQALYSRLVDVLGSIYAKIDFPDEDLNEMDRDQMREHIESVCAEVSGLALTYKTGRAVSQGIPTVICGHTNVGKSSIYNRIVGQDAAIVTDIEGTTRDILRQTVSFGGVTLRISDTAGIRYTSDVVENIGIERAREEIERSELVLAVVDLSESLNEEDKKFYSELSKSGKTVIGLYNKSDIADREMSEKYHFFERSVALSAKTGEGFDKLEKMIEELFLNDGINIYSDAVVMDERQYSALKATEEALLRASNDIKQGIPLDLCCVGVEEAMTSLGELDGREIGEDIVSNIFSKFCVGK